jgi:hypothetical protein
VVWVARYTGRDGKRRVAKPSWNRGKGTFARKGEAQRAIDEAYEIATTPDTLGEYFATWIERHPRSERTNATYEHRVSRVTDVEIEGTALKDWPMHELRRRHTLALVEHMLTNEGRATTGAVGMLRSLSAMAEDAITDEVCDLNPFKGIRVRANDSRAQKKRRPIRVFSFEEMHRFAKVAGRYEALVRTRRGGRRPRRPHSRDPRLDARSPDQPQRPRLPTPLPNPPRPPLARAHLLPRRLEADPGSRRHRHAPPRVSPQLRHPPPRSRH